MSEKTNIKLEFSLPDGYEYRFSAAQKMIMGLSPDKMPIWIDLQGNIYEPGEGGSINKIGVCK